MQIGHLQQFLTHGFACAAFKQHIIGHDHGSAPVVFEHGVNMLQEVDLFVGSGCPKVLTVIDKIFSFGFALGIGNGHAAFFARMADWPKPGPLFVDLVQPRSHRN